MMFHNVDHVNEATLKAQSQHASSLFFLAMSRLFEALATLETFEISQSIGYGKVCAALLDLATEEFRKLGERIREMKWLRDEVRGVDQKLAAFEAALPPELPELSEIKSFMLRGDFHLVFDSCANDIAKMSTSVSGIVAILEREKDDPSRIEYRPIHELIGQWRALIAKGQLVSTAVGLAQTTSVN